MTAGLAICYVADLDFLFPTLLSIRSLRRFVPPAAAEVFIICLDPDQPAFNRVRDYARALSVTVLPLSLADHVQVDASQWNRTHVPHSALGRFFMEGLLPPHVTRILYLDGDTLFVRDPTPLLALALPPDALAAVEDISYFARDDRGRYGRETRAYFAGLNLDGRHGYFNSGILLAGRDAWRQITREAAAFFQANPARCLYHDQSALNAVVGSRRVRLSPTWNFQTPFCYWGVRNSLSPHILHFTEFPKPWMGPAKPWTGVQPDIQALSKDLLSLGLPTNHLGAAQLAAYSRRNQGRQTRLWTIYALRLLRRRRDVRRLVKAAAL